MKKNILYILTLFFIASTLKAQTKISQSKTLFISGFFNNDVFDAYELGDIVFYLKIINEKNRRLIKHNGKWVKSKSEDVGYLRLKNNSCLDARYKVTYTTKDVSDGFEIVGFNEVNHTFKGIIKANSDILINKFYVGTRLLKYQLKEISALNKQGIVINDDNWKNNLSVLKCLGYNSVSDFQKHINKLETAAILKKAEEKRKAKEKKDKEISDKNKGIEKWKIKGLDVHIAKYKKKRINGMYAGVPADSLEMIAKHLNLPLIIINTGQRKYKKGTFKLDEQSINFLKKNFVVGVYHQYSRSFWPWVRKNKYKVRLTPTVILLEIDKPIKMTGYNFVKNFNDNVNKMLLEMAKVTH